jgi:imidazolonepropionase
MSTVLFRNIGHLLSMAGVAAKDARHVQEADLSIQKDMAMAVQGGKISWLGPNKKIPKSLKVKKEIDLQKSTVLPGFVECHTHTLFAGSRAAEFEMRLQGVSYQEIAKAGGGILSTVRATRKASSPDLIKLAEKRVKKFLSQGVTTLEIKTGYALDQKNELRTLKAIQSLGGKGPQIVSTFLGAHSIPPEFSDAREYLKSIESYLPQVRKLTNRLDIWIEKGFFEKDFSKEYLKKAKALGFDLVVHADQLSLSGGTELAVELGAVSADHVIQISDREIQLLAKSKTTAVLLPMADLYMKCAYPPAKKMIEAGVRVALATDFNPGTCPSQDLATVGLLARLEMQMSLPQVLAAYTFAAAAALNLQEKIGSLELKKDANFICINDDWSSLFYSSGSLLVEKIFVNGGLIRPHSK